MAIAISTLILAAVMGDPGALARPGMETVRAWSVPVATATAASVAVDGAAVPAANDRGRGVTGDPSRSSAKAVVLALATTAFVGWSLARTVARWIA